MISAGQAPQRTASVSPSLSGTEAWMTRCSEIPERSTTSPSEVTTALNPVGATCITQRSVSIARSLLEAICCDCKMVSQ